MAVRATALTDSSRPAGNQPRLWRAWRGVPFSTAEQRRTKVKMLQIIQEVVTEAMRPLMTEGASRDSCAEGRVVREM